MKLARIKLIVFDLDGTLVNSVHDIARAINEVLKIRGFNEHPIQNYENFIGCGLRRTLELAAPKRLSYKEIDKMFNAVIASYNENLVGKVYPGISDLLVLIGSMRIPAIVYSNKLESLARNTVDFCFPKGTFREVIGLRDDSAPKPNPKALNRYLKDRDIPSSAVLLVGDSRVDVETALRGGFIFAGALWGYGSGLNEAGSKQNFLSPWELMNWLISDE